MLWTHPELVQQGAPMTGLQLLPATSYLESLTVLRPLLIHCSQPALLLAEIPVKS